jgi:hypothetical protein
MGVKAVQRRRRQCTTIAACCPPPLQSQTGQILTHHLRQCLRRRRLRLSTPAYQPDPARRCTPGRHGDEAAVVDVARHRHGGHQGDAGAVDALAAHRGCRLQGATRVALTNLDVLGYLPEIPLCTAYEIDGERVVEQLIDTPVRLLSVGPARDALIHRDP